MSIANQMKNAAAALVATTALALTTPATALAFGHSAPDKLKNASIASGLLAGGVVAYRVRRRRKEAQAAALNIA